MFGGWISYSHPSITETFARMDIDFIAIDMDTQLYRPKKLSE